MHVHVVICLFCLDCHVCFCFNSCLVSTHGPVSGCRPCVSRLVSPVVSLHFVCLKPCVSVFSVFSVLLPDLLRPSFDLILISGFLCFGLFTMLFIDRPTSTCFLILNPILLFFCLYLYAIECHYVTLEQMRGHVLSSLRLARIRSCNWTTILSTPAIQHLNV